MAERRMFAKTVVKSDAFLDMPLSAQALYFHLSMWADDEGFINNPKMVRRMIGASDDDLRLLVAKKFIIPFESGVVVIKHWWVHNYIPKDRYKKTVYQEERALLTVKDNNAYSLHEKCIQDVYKMETQDRLGKDRLGKDKERERVISADAESPPSEQKTEIIDAIKELTDAYAALCPTLPQIRKMTKKRKEAAKNALKQLSLNELREAFEIAGKTSFLAGRNDRGWKAGFDWLIDPTNAVKVLEGKYADGTPVNRNNRFHNFDQRQVNYDALLDGEFGGRRRRKSG